MSKTDRCAAWAVVLPAIRPQAVGGHAALSAAGRAVRGKLPPRPRLLGRAVRRHARRIRGRVGPGARALHAARRHHLRGQLQLSVEDVPAAHARGSLQHARHGPRPRLHHHRRRLGRHRPRRRVPARRRGLRPDRRRRRDHGRAARSRPSARVDPTRFHSGSGVRTRRRGHPDGQAARHQGPGCAAVPRLGSRRHRASIARSGSSATATTR